MKININVLKGIAIVIFILNHSNGFSQATTAGGANFPILPAVEYLGWANGVNEVVNIKNEDSWRFRAN